MCWVSVDVEADGPIPGDYSMLAIGAVIIEPHPGRIFYTRLRPVSEKWLEQAIKICGFTREQTMEFEEPQNAMINFREWLYHEGGKNLFFVSDNGFDWQYINWYFHHFLNENPFGYNSTNVRSLYAGVMRDVYKRYRLHKKPRIHNPLDDALENALQVLTLKADYDLKIHL